MPLHNIYSANWSVKWRRHALPVRPSPLDIKLTSPILILIFDPLKFKSTLILLLSDRTRYGGSTPIQKLFHKESSLLQKMHRNYYLKANYKNILTKSESDTRKHLKSLTRYKCS